MLQVPVPHEGLGGLAQVLLLVGVGRVPVPHEGLGGDFLSREVLRDERSRSP